MSAQSVIRETADEPSIEDLGLARLLDDGIFVAAAKAETPDVFVIEKANAAFAGLIRRKAEEIIGQPVGDVFCTPAGKAVSTVLSRAAKSGERQVLDTPFNSGSGERQLRITIIPNGTSFLVTCNDRTAAVRREAFLAAQNQKPGSATSTPRPRVDELQNEVHRLRERLREMERMVKFDRPSGLPNRASFLEKAAAEFQRCSRYDHSLALVILRILPRDGEPGELDYDDALASLGAICETAGRSGADIAGRLEIDQLAILMPETTLAGALIFVDRLRSITAQTPTMMGNSKVRYNVGVGCDAIQSNDIAFTTMLKRAVQSLKDDAL